ncbi:hypothetical protein C0J50_18555 [Silurus asotus]|uniref:Uncharacterized protein n=1 Tax=Silurus asotus TaxID=30991 RepID=A0AAD5AS69_SILAS|nr:hypothetical protein C0J50_18555 [Silurus asotus]
MHARRLVKRSLIGSRVYAPGSGAAVAAAGGEAGERENRDAPVPSGHAEDEAVKGARKPSLKSGMSVTTIIIFVIVITDFVERKR